MIAMSYLMVITSSVLIMLMIMESLYFRKARTLKYLDDIKRTMNREEMNSFMYQV